VLEYFEDPSDCKRFFEGEVRKLRGNKRQEFDPTHLNSGLDDEDMGQVEDDEGLGPSISIFLLQTMKSSPKYKKGTKFRSNLKSAIKACDTEDFF
jgi:nucleolar MIF4G domain-containing protein 1